MVAVTKPSPAGTIKHPKRVVERNIALLGEVMRYLLAELQLLASLPENFELVILPDDDPALRRYNLELVDAYDSAGKPIVFVRTKAARTPDPARLRPTESLRLHSARWLRNLHHARRAPGRCDRCFLHGR